MNILLIGANGQLGTEVLRAFGGNVIPLTHKDVEIADAGLTEKMIEIHKPDVLINTAAYHNAPDCEKNPETAFGVNAIGPKNLAKICNERGILLVHISTDYVFDGRKETPYTEEDSPRPLNTYGISKLAGEFFVSTVEKHYILRVSSLFGVTGCRAKGGRNFVKNMLELAKTKDRIQVTANVICTPTYARDAALKIKEMLEEGYPSGIYHCANSGFCSWHEFSVEIFRLIGSSIQVEQRIETEELEGIKRPLYSPLASVKTKPLRHWREALRDYLHEEITHTKGGIV